MKKKINNNNIDNLHTQLRNLNILKYYGFQIDSGATLIKSLDIRDNDLEKEPVHPIKYIDDYIRFWESKRYDYPWDLDGLVIKVNSIALQNVLGETSRSPRWAFAYKFNAKTATSQVKEIVLQVGRTGRVTPVAELDPVEIAGVTISRATLNNIPFMEKLQIGPSSRVVIERAGDVIPKITKVLDPTSQPLTEILPSINHQLVCPCKIASVLEKKPGYVDYFCTHQECPSQSSQQIHWFADKKAMDISGLGPSQIDEFIKHGYIEDLGDLFLLHQYKDKMLQLKGYSHTKVNNILDSIEASKSKGLEYVLCGIGIPGIGRSNSKKLAFAFGSLDAIISCPSPTDIAEKSGLGAQISESIHSFFHPIDPEEKDYIDQLLFKLKKNNVKLTISSDNTTANNDNNDITQDNRFRGKNVVITGKFDMGERDLVKDHYQRYYGAKVQSSLNSRTDFLIVGEKPADAKIKKANQLGIPIINGNEQHQQQ